ncbi:Hypothetical protein R9X50_00400700 [Acrodontium crateriforme]|uniref:LsmAD domain-containing protein n=1 Tax=Acrodontium crateriforme TaxID=150365 RepID=A0AAQ3R9W1_9PEZI|nr:Hypothetical protein R9X50_00400700 [Acrodontium crateriforme]
MATSKQPLKSSNGAKALDGARRQAASPVDGQNSRKQQPSQPKAWQGVNPITARPAASTPNGIEKPLPKLPPTLSDGKSNGDANTHSRASDRLYHLFANIIGTDVTLTLQNGEQFTGVFSGASLDPPSKSKYVLKMTKRTRLPTHQQSNGTTELSDEYTGEGDHYTMSFDIQDTVHLEALNVTTTSNQTIQNRSTTPSFRTDTEISGKDAQLLRERELQPWDSGADSNVDLSLESSSTAGWDQFAANERLYGVQSTYDENIYTTQINRSDPQYRQREAQAAKIAREIEESAPANAHVAEERTQNAKAGEGGLDEEDKYSGVKRDTSALPKRAAGAYVPPSQRPLTNAPTVPGAPFDPAIISLAKPTPSTTPAAISDKVTATMPPIRVEAPKPDPTEATVAETTAPVTATVQKKPTENTTEDHVRGTVDAFKQFANNEKLRMRQAQEAKRSNARYEKNVKLNDLKKFAANFKLNSRVPDDLVPILAKDREKQIEIKRKAEEAANNQNLKSKEKATNTSSPTATSSSSSQAAVTPSPDSRSQFNQQARGRLPQPQQQQPVPQPMRAPNAPAQAPAARPSPNQRPNAGAQTFNRSVPQPLPADLRIPATSANPPSDRTLSPLSATKLNVNAFEFRPSASHFTPSVPGTTPSPQRPAATAPAPPTKSAETPSKFFRGNKKCRTEPFDKNAFNYLRQYEGEETTKTTDGKSEDEKPGVTGVPKPYRTAPTWPSDSSTSFKDTFPKAQVPGPGISPMHTPNIGGHMSQGHQGPSAMHGVPNGTPQRPYYPPQQFGHNPNFDPRMQQFASNHNSPRTYHAQMAFNNQVPQQMQMPQFGGQPQPGYGMSPSMPFRQIQMPPGQMMVMPGQQQGQMQQMRPGYNQGPPYGGPPMGGHMMVQNPSSGGYSNGPMPQNPYSPMPPHAQPHMPHMQQGGPGTYNNGPRAPMMQHQGSHQGFQPQMHMQPHQFMPGQAQPHPYHLQHNQRQHSGGHSGGQQFPQMTPRQHNAAPQHPSPGMGNAAGQGDEGK